jgi:hypothetical protein
MKKHPKNDCGPHLPREEITINASRIAAAGRDA